jgi:hypothetical protein
MCQRMTGLLGEAGAAAVGQLRALLLPALPVQQQQQQQQPPGHQEQGQ